MTGLAKVGDRIEHGQPIPGNVRVLRDRVGDRWWRNALGHWHPVEYDDPATCADTRVCAEVPEEWWPLTVVEVDPEPQHADVRPIPRRCSDNSAEHPPHEWIYAPGTAAVAARYLCAGAAREPQPAEGMCAQCGDRSAARGSDVCATCERGNAMSARNHAAFIAEGCCGMLAVHFADCPQYDEAEQRAKVEKYLPSQPIVLRLPEVPKSAQLQGQRTGRTWMWSEAFQLWITDTDKRNLGDLLNLEGEVIVQVAPPREPRTWEQITDDTPAEELPNIVRVTRPSGPEIWALDRNGVYFRKGDGVGLTLVELRTLGEVREVIEP